MKKLLPTILDLLLIVLALAGSEHVSQPANTEGDLNNPARCSAPNCDNARGQNGRVSRDESKLMGHSTTF